MFILYPQLNNQLAILVPTGDVKDVIKDVPQGVEYRIVESINIDNYFFDAYEFDSGTGLKINIEKAKEIQLNKFRSARTPLLANLDIEFIIAMENGDKTLQKSIAAKKQKLRDVTNVNLPDDLDGIKATWPDILN